MSVEELKVRVYGDFLPRHLFGMFHIVFAALRSLYLALYLYFFISFHYDLIIVDQISYGVPILRHCATRLLFYCHYPDKYLAPRSKNPLRLSYRVLFDRWEEATIVKADKVVVNSLFTAQQFVKAFPSAKRPPAVLYPGVHCLPNTRVSEKMEELRNKLDLENCFTILSLNRFERKKNIKLAVTSFHQLYTQCASFDRSKLRLIIAGTLT